MSDHEQRHRAHQNKLLLDTIRCSWHNLFRQLTQRPLEYDDNLRILFLCFLCSTIL